jgi:hypothetical protein
LRDVVWLGKSHGEWIKSKIHSDDKKHNSDDEPDALEAKPALESTLTDELKNKKFNRALREASRLQCCFYPNPTRFLENADPGRELIVDKADRALHVIEKPTEPQTFEQANNHPNLEDRNKWIDAISKELQEVNEKKVYEKISKSELPNCRKCIKNKWVFEIKFFVHI